MKTYAAELLAAAGIDRRLLAEALPRVDPGQVPVWVAGPCFTAFWVRSVAAVSMPWGIYLRPAVAAGSQAALAPLVVHELAHIDQWRRLGARRWVVSYLGDYLRGRLSGRPHQQAYRGIGLEVDARAAARQVIGS